MTTLKPQLVRADTIDLQDHDAPSAKDHTRQPTHPAPFGQGPAAPHQQQALRHAEHEAYHDQRISPRASEEHENGAYPHEQNFYEDNDEDLEPDHLHGGAAGGMNGASNDYDNGEEMDDDLDDDLMDKISSSPSISDGKYALPVWPRRSSSIESGRAPSPFSPPTRGEIDSSSPYTSPMDYPPVSRYEQKDHSIRHHPGEYEEHKAIPGNCPTESEPPRTVSEDGLYRWSENAPAGSQEYKNVGHYFCPDDDLPMHQNDGLEAGWLEDDSEWEDADDSDSSDDDEDDDGTFRFTTDTRFLDSGWGGECLREIEDIDFEFVYALHTFVATVEGQANATKGDTMVLLDDSNSYWWLVRVVKDGSIGYLPAEHIETPTERLARLNKHRNIDLSATMLGDNPEKSRNPLKKAMRRRNAKTVQFAAPTYYEPSEYTPSDDEEEEDEESQLQSENVEPVDEKDLQEDDQAAMSAPAPLSANTTQNGPMTNGVRKVVSDESLQAGETSPVKTETLEALAVTSHNGEMANRSRKGVVRNTDSFFKDDSVETKKISLTPRLLRGEPDANAPIEHDSRQRPSLEAFEKMIGPEDKVKDDKKKKEKKGMLSGLFKRKDKAPKAVRGDSEDSEKVSEDSIGISPQSKESMESFSKAEPSPERRPSKLQKQPPNLQRPESRTTTDGASMSPTSPTSIPAPTGPAPAPPISQPVTLQSINTNTSPVQPTSPVSPITPNGLSSSGEKKSLFAPLAAALNPSPSNSSLEHDGSGKPIHSKRAKKRFAIDDSGSEEDRTPTTDQHHRSISPEEEEDAYGAPTQHTSRAKAAQEHDADSAGGVDHPQDGPSPPSATNAPESDEGTNSPKESPSIEAPTPSTSRSTPTWSDSSLRTYMDNDQSIRDLLIIVHDSSNITPVGSDHPLVGSLFANERSRLAEMQSNLDSLLTGWMSKKNSALLTR